MATSNRSVNEKWFRDRITDRGTSARQVAHQMGLDPAAMSLMLRGKRGMSPQEAADLSQILGVSYEDVLKHAGIALPTDSKKMVPVVGVVDDAGLVSATVSGPRRVERSVGTRDDMAALRIQVPNDPTDGWTAFYVPSGRLEPDAVGRLAVVQARGKGAPRYLGVLQKGYERDKWSLVPLRVGVAGARVDGVAVEWAAPVLWIRV
jgi:transcriptional regulator with XRE-family HTH domain